MTETVEQIDMVEDPHAETVAMIKKTISKVSNTGAAEANLNAGADVNGKEVVFNMGFVFLGKNHPQYLPPVGDLVDIELLNVPVVDFATIVDLPEPEAAMLMEIHLNMFTDAFPEIKMDNGRDGYALYLDDHLILFQMMPFEHFRTVH